MAKQNNKKRKFTFNIIDALIIFILLAVIALIVYVFILGNDIDDLISRNEDNTENVKNIEPSTIDHKAISNTNYRIDENVIEKLL